MLNAVVYLAIASSFLVADDGAKEVQATKVQTTAAKQKPIPKAEFTNAGHTVDSVEDVHQFVKSKRAVLLDVREEEEWDAGHLKFAKLVPLSVIRKGELPEELAKRFPKDKPIYLHCQAGGRVLMAAEILQSKGYDLRPLRPGYPKLLESGFGKAKSKMDKKDKTDRSKDK